MIAAACPRGREDRREFRNRHSRLKAPLYTEDFAHLDEAP